VSLITLLAIVFTQQGRKFQIRFPMWSLGFFYWLNLSGRNMVLGSTQPLTEMNTRCILSAGGI